MQDWSVLGENSVIRKPSSFCQIKRIAKERRYNYFLWNCKGQKILKSNKPQFHNRKNFQ